MFLVSSKDQATTTGQKRVVANSRGQEKPKSLSPEQQLAIISKRKYLPDRFVEQEYADGLPEDDILVVRFRYLLQNLDVQTIQSKQEIVDITATAQQVLRNKYGREVRVLDLMERMNKMISSWPSDVAEDYAYLMGIYVQTLK